LSKQLAGVLPVFQTPYHDDETFDAATLRREIDWLYSCGVDGIVMAMVSEVLRLSSDERMKLAEMACEMNAGRGAVVISVGAESSKSAEMFAAHAENAGADAVMAIPPVSIAIGERELTRYFERILNATSLPLIVQDASGYVGRPMSIETQAKLHRTWGAGRVMFKPEAAPIGPRLTELRDATNGEAKVFEGTGGVALVDSFRRGIVGTMPGADLIRGIVALWKALVARDERRVAGLDNVISKIVALQNSLDAFLAVEKYLLVKQGVFRSTLVRGPVGYHMDDATTQQVERLFDEMIAVVDGGTQ
jgi:4-hydroxy-tetrahydrodipicolinate synthase